MNCSRCGAELPGGGEILLELCSPCADAAGTCGYRGGAYYGGSVQAGGDIIGRDQVIHGSSLRNSRQGLQGEEIATLAASFQAVYGQIDRRVTQDPDADPVSWSIRRRRSSKRRARARTPIQSVSDDGWARSRSSLPTFSSWW